MIPKHKISLPDGEYHCYTDGSVHNRIGGWGFVIFNSEEIITGYGGAINTTINQMEMYAAMMALSCFEYIDEFSGPKITVHTDSRYLKDGITSYIHKWVQNGYRSASGTKVLNVRLWRHLYKTQMQLAPEWIWVPSHTGIKYNEMADDLANIGRNLAKQYKAGKKVKGSIHNFFSLDKPKRSLLLQGNPCIRREKLR